jgi:uncharacterized protein (DUF2252 family)
VLFFEATASRWQIGRVHQCDGMRLPALAAEQLAQQMLIDLAQSAHAHSLPKLMEHPHARPMPTQSAEAAPGRLFGKLGHHQVERMRRGQQRQQMHPPQLRRTQGTPASTGELART